MIEQKGAAPLQISKRVNHLICPEKRRLIDELAAVMKRILALHSEEAEALIQGALETDTRVAQQLQSEQVRRAALLQQLKAHQAEHRC